MPALFAERERLNDGAARGEEDERELEVLRDIADMAEQPFAPASELTIRLAGDGDWAALLDRITGYMVDVVLYDGTSIGHACLVQGVGRDGTDGFETLELTAFDTVDDLVRLLPGRPVSQRIDTIHHINIY